MSVKSHCHVDSAGENDEPCDERVDCHGRQKRRADGHDSKHDEQDSPDDGPPGSLA